MKNILNLNSKEFKSNSHFLKNINFILVTLLIVLFISSCGLFYTKDNYLKEFGKFIQDVKTNSPNYTEADWAKADLQFEKLTIEQYDKFKPELIESDKEVIGKLKAAYTLLKLKKEGSDAIENTKDLLYQVKGMMEEVIDSTNIN